MSDYQDPDLDINIDLNMDESKMDKAHKQLTAIETIWNRLSNLPTINFENKIKQGKITKDSGGKFGIFSADLESTLAGNVRESESIKKLSYSWDSLYNQELQLLQNKEKQEKTLSLLSSSVSEKMKSIPASSTGKYHPTFAQGEGGLIKHSKAVAQTAYGLAGMLNVPGDKDRFVVAGLMHDMWKLGPEGNSQFTDPKHGALAADFLTRAGMSAEADLAGPHMGNFFKGSYKNAPKISNFDQRLLNNADWLMSRTYAQDYVTWEKDAEGKETGNISDINIAGVRDEALKRKDARLDKKTGLLIPMVEEQEKAAKAAKKMENSWHSMASTAGLFLGILKTIAGLGMAALTIGIKETAAGAQQVNGGLGMFTGTTNSDILSNSLREAKAGIGVGSINKAVAGLASKRGQFKLTGAGDLLPMAMAGTIEGLMLSDKPMQEVYGQIIDMFTKQLLSTKDQAQKDKLLALVQSNLGPEAAYLVNAQAQLGSNWEGMGARTSPAAGFGDWTKQVMEVNAAMQTSLNGIKDTWKGLFVDFMFLFGNPFLGWIDTVFRALGTTAEGYMQGRKAEDTYLGLYNSLTPAQKNKMMKGSLLGQYDKTRYDTENAYQREVSAIANEGTTAAVNAFRRSRGLEPFSDLDFRSDSATVRDYTRKNAGSINLFTLQRARAIADKYGVSYTASDTVEDIKRKASEAGLNAVDDKQFGREIPGFNSNPMATAKNWYMFDTPANKKKFPKAMRLMEQFPDLENTNRLSSAFDSTMQGVMDALSSGVMTESQVLPILENYMKVLEGEKTKDDKKGAMSGMPQINMNFSLPNGSDPNAVRAGILDASREIPRIVNDAYQSMYAGGYG